MSLLRRLFSSSSSLILSSGVRGADPGGDPSSLPLGPSGVRGAGAGSSSPGRYRPFPLLADVSRPSCVDPVDMREPLCILRAREVEGCAGVSPLPRRPMGDMKLLSTASPSAFLALRCSLNHLIFIVAWYLHRRYMRLKTTCVSASHPGRGLIATESPSLFASCSMSTAMTSCSSTKVAMHTNETKYRLAKMDVFIRVQLPLHTRVYPPKSQLMSPSSSKNLTSSSVRHPGRACRAKVTQWKASSATAAGKGQSMSASIPKTVSFHFLIATAASLVETTFWSTWCS
mmetsp:Transcript_1822/g.4373  ORF Transcript_1822/g.4373 Transcript_1822/m.4373 type:complete len:286 (-) Transcript_1822:2287-3144(-)